MHIAIRLLSLLGLILILNPGAAHPADPPESVRQFLDRHCLDCHDGAEGEGGFDLHSLAGADAPQSLDRWPGSTASRASRVNNCAA